MVDSAFAVDLAAAERSLLTVSDVPPGWEELPAVDDAADSASEERIASCAGYEVGELYPGDTVPNALSPTFRSPEEAEVFAAVRIASSTREARDALDRLDHETTLGCIADEVRRLQGSTGSPSDEVTVADVRVERTPIPPIGDERVAVQIVVSLQTDGAPFELYLDVVTVRVGRGVAQLRAFSPLDPFDVGEVQRYTRVLADRMEEEVP